MAASSSGDLQIVIRAIDEASAVLAKAQKDVQGLTQTTTDSNKQSGLSFGSLAGAVAAGNAIWSMASGVVHKFGDTIKDSIQESNQQELALTRLQAGINNVTSATDKHIGALVSQAEAMQRTTRFSDDQVISAQGILSTFQLNQTAIQQLTPRLADMSEGLARATGEMPDLEQNAIMVARALGGEDTAGLATALRRVGVVMTDAQQQMLQTGNMQQRLATITQVLDGNFRGLADAAGNTTAGKMTQLQHSVDDVHKQLGSLVTSAIAPAVQGLTSFVTQNQALIVSVLVAGAAVAGLIAAVGALAGAVVIFSIVATSAFGPLIPVLLILGALLGSFVYESMQKAQSGMKNMNQAAIEAGSGLGNAIPQGASKANESLAKLGQQLADIDESIQKANRDFQQSMADMVHTHQQKVDDLKSQIAKETDDFSKAQADKAEAFKQSQEDQATQHQRSVDDIQTEIDRELLKGRHADQTKLADLRLRLARENEDYKHSTDEKQAQYDKDTANAKAQQDTKMADLQKQLDAETMLLQKHASDVLSVQGVQLQDELEKLKQSHNDQMAEFAKQKQRAIESAQQTTGGMASAFNALPSMVNTNALSGVGDTLGKNMATALKNAFKDTFKQWWSAWGNWVNDFGNKVGKAAIGEITGSGSPLAALGKLISNNLPTFASGVTNFSGGMAVVGENGPELVSLPAGSSVLSNRESKSMVGSGTTIYQTNNIYTQTDLELANRELGWRLAVA